MAVPSNLYQAPTLRGNREDLIDKIFNTSPTETPVVSSMGRTTATAVFHEWQRDALASANKDNAMIDGDDVTLDSQTPTDRVGNYMQIFSKKPGVSRRANKVKKAGRASEIGYLKAKAMLEIKRDIEASVLSDNVAVPPTTSVAGKSGGLGVQSYANVSHGVSGATPSWTTGAPTGAVTAGTNRTFTEALLKTVLQSTFIASGEIPGQLYLSPSHKGTFSAFAGVGNVNRVNLGKKEQAKIVGGADIYMSDFGAIEAVPHYLMSGFSVVHGVNSDYGDIAFLDGFQTSELGKSGDSERWLITADCGLALRAPKAFFKIADLTP